MGGGNPETAGIFIGSGATWSGTYGLTGICVCMSGLGGKTMCALRPSLRKSLTRFRFPSYRAMWAFVWSFFHGRMRFFGRTYWPFSSTTGFSMCNHL